MKRETIEKGMRLVKKIDILEKQVEKVDHIHGDTIIIKNTFGDLVWSDDLDQIMVDKVMDAIKTEFELRLNTAKLELENLTDYESKPTE